MGFMDISLSFHIILAKGWSRVLWCGESMLREECDIRYAVKLLCRAYDSVYSVFHLFIRLNKSIKHEISKSDCRV